MDFMSLAKDRWSCRKFDSKMVEDDKIAQVLRAAQIAPSACNKQPLKFLVLKGEAVKKIEHCARLYGAPVVIAVLTNESEAWQRKYDAQNFAIVDGAIAMDHMMLMATSLGLGSLFVGAVKTDLLTEALKIKEPWKVQFLMPLGLKAQEAVPDPLHEKRKSLDELCEVMEDL